ncbi:MAG: RnfABCDGE type electron transport complex subunit B [Proteobacteria bacterium]|nr:RnfABCDGE type electron transport complex subunit B [Pseudomonadota bacterium]
MSDTANDPLAVCIEAIHGIKKPPATAFIDEIACIGCTLCIQACPVDAIIGAAKQMHTIVTAWCTGCELCLPPCPVDCIDMLPLLDRIEDPQAAAERARQRHEFHLLRGARDQREKAERLAAKAAARLSNAAADTRQALIAAAIARARQLNAR